MEKFPLLSAVYIEYRDDWCFESHEFNSCISRRHLWSQVYLHGSLGRDRVLALITIPCRLIDLYHTSPTLQ